MLGCRATIAAAAVAAFAVLVDPDALLAQEVQSPHPQCRTDRSKIVGGARARLRDWPGVAALRLHSPDGAVSSYFCGGTVIADRWILTAAHCLHDHTAKLTAPIEGSDGQIHEGHLEVVIDVADLGSAEATHVRKVEQVILHEAYGAALKEAQEVVDPDRRAQALDDLTQLGNDIALLRLSQPWSGSRAQLSLSETTELAGEPETQALVAGFGTTERNQANAAPDRFVGTKGELFAGSRRLLEAAIALVGEDACRRRYPTATIGPGQICAGLEQSARDSCQGDSGGPLVVRDAGNCPQQIGLVSWGVGCGERDDVGNLYYGVYTRVSYYAAWIEQHTGPLPRTRAPLLTRSLTAAQLDEALRQLDGILRRARHRVAIGVRGGNRVRLGQEVVFEAHSKLAGRIVIVDINAEREVRLLYPNTYVPLNDPGHIAAGDRVAVPGPKYPGFSSFVAQEPLGKGLLLALVTPPDFAVERYIADEASLTKGFMPRRDPQNYMMRLVRQIELAVRASDTTAALSADGPERWGYAVAEYEIMP